MVNNNNRKAVFNVVRNHAIAGGHAARLENLVHGMAYNRPRTTNQARAGWQRNMNRARTIVMPRRTHYTEILTTSRDPAQLMNALRQKANISYLSQERIRAHIGYFSRALIPREQFNFYDEPNYDQADAYGIFLAELLRRRTEYTPFDTNIPAFTMWIAEYMRAPRFLPGVFVFLCALSKPRCMKVLRDLFASSWFVLPELERPDSNRTTRWNRLFKLIRCITTTKAEKLAALRLYVTKVNDPIAREVTQLTRLAKSRVSIADQAHFMRDIITKRRPEPSVALARAIFQPMTPASLRPFFDAYARLEAPRRIHTRGRQALPNVRTINTRRRDAIVTRFTGWRLYRDRRP